MNSELFSYITLICMSGVLNLYLCVRVFVKRAYYSSIAHLFIVYLVSIIVYCFASAFTLVSETLSELKFWTVILYIGMPISVPLGLLFIMQYLGIKVTKKRIVLLTVIPIISFLMVVTNDWHHLHYRVYEIDPTLGAPYIHQEPGFWYLVHGAYTFGCMFVAFLLGVSRWKETIKAYRMQLLSIILGQLIPMVTAFLYLMGATPPGFDPVPMVMWITSVLYLWSMSSSRMFMVKPVAKTVIFNSINDGVFVLDEKKRLIEFNLASSRMFPDLTQEMLGRSFEEVWQLVSKGEPSFFVDADRENEELSLFDREQLEKVYQVRTMSLQGDKGVIEGLLLIFTDITELKRLQKQLEHHAYYDELTSVFNRRAFFQQAEKQLQEARRNGKPFTVILIDIDYFKKVNDTYGHQVGDDVLIHAAQESQSVLPPNHVFFARYGGEEFALALDGYNLREAEEVAEKLRKHIEARPLLTSTSPVPVTLSLGVAQASCAEESLYQLLNQADKALYVAKQNGRNRVVTYDPENFK